MTIRKSHIYLIGAALIVSSAVFFYRHRQTSHEGQVLLRAVPIQTPYGWGYNILEDNKIYIHQEFMPGIPGKHGFATKEDAVLVGNRVIEKISSNQMPTMDSSDLRTLGIFKDSVPGQRP
jgi:Domain of unknown function (DUF4907)